MRTALIVLFATAALTAAPRASAGENDWSWVYGLAGASWTVNQGRAEVTISGKTIEAKMFDAGTGRLALSLTGTINGKGQVKETRVKVHEHDGDVSPYEMRGTYYRNDEMYWFATETVILNTPTVFIGLTRSEKKHRK